MQAEQQQQHESWNVIIRAEACRMFAFTVKAFNISTAWKFQRLSLLLRLHSFIFLLNLESEPAAAPIPRQTLKSKLLKIVKKVRICPWKKKTSAPKKDVKALANPLKKSAFKIQTLKSKLLKIVKKIRICPWKKKTSAPKKDVKALANPLKKSAFEKTRKISPFWLVLMVACLSAAVWWMFFHLNNYVKFESAYILQYVSEAFKFAGSIANEILDKFYEL